MIENERKELLVTELDKVFLPTENISPNGEKNKWRSVSYKTSGPSGSFLVSLSHGNPEDVSYDPKLSGWYKIFLVLPCFTPQKLYIKLLSDSAFRPVRNLKTHGYMFEEVLWRCADMSGESIVLTRRHTALRESSALAGIRFVPMSDGEVEAFLHERERTDTKRLYCTDDIHNKFCEVNMSRLEDWDMVVDPLVDSDAEWISAEDIRLFTGGKCSGPVAEHGFFRDCDEVLMNNIGHFEHDKILKRIVDRAHEKGLLASISLRMGAWGIEFPYDQTYFDCDFLFEHPEWYCIDRNGEEINAWSYAYPEVRRFMIDVLLNDARLGADAVTLIGHRGTPYVLFEQPVIDRFFELYGFDPRTLPLDDPRVSRVHCEFMTAFFTELREALDNELGKNKVEIHLRSQLSPYDARFVGFDVEELAAKGLITAIISYPQRFASVLPESVWKGERGGEIDLEKYTEAVNAKPETTFLYQDFDFRGPYTNSRGESVGPATQSERIAEWNAIEDKYGVKVYFEIFPRVMVNTEFKRRAVELYDCGARRLGLWDTFMRYPYLALWQLLSRLGHKDTLADTDAYRGLYKDYRVLKIGSYNVNRYKPMWGG